MGVGKEGVRLFSKHPDLGDFSPLFGVDPREYRGEPLLPACADFYGVIEAEAVQLTPRGGFRGNWKAISGVTAAFKDWTVTVDLSDAQRDEKGLPLPGEMVARTLAALGLTRSVDMVLKWPEIAMMNPDVP